jgi:hypothetical protein
VILRPTAKEKRERERERERERKKILYFDVILIKQKPEPVKLSISISISIYFSKKCLNNIFYTDLSLQNVKNILKHAQLLEQCHLMFYSHCCSMN